MRKKAQYRLCVIKERPCILKIDFVKPIAKENQSSRRVRLMEHSHLLIDYKYLQPQERQQLKILEITKTFPFAE